MKKQPMYRTLALIVLIGLLSTMIAACNRQASTPPPSVQATNQAASTAQNLGLFDTAATQTAAALVAQPPAGVTPVVPMAATATPIPVVVEEQKPAPTAAPANLPVATPGIPQTYTLQKGEYPYCIARRFNVNPSELLALNGLGSSSTVYAGMTLKIPQSGNPFVTDRALKSHPTSYTVQSGDTIYTIACAFGDVSPDMIALANGLNDPYVITLGQTLQIP